MQKIVHFVVPILISASSLAQYPTKTYDDYEKLYGHFSENDPRAHGFINQSISEAKSRKDFAHLTQVYEDALYFSKAPRTKLHYADSAISAALHTKDPNLVANAYLGKGIVYYFNSRDYHRALRQYIKANEALKGSANFYLKHKIEYHIGVVKKYLGRNKEAEVHLKDALDFFKRNYEKKNLHVHESHNFAKGYLNSLYQLSITSRNLENNLRAKAYTNEGLALLDNLDGFSEERGKLRLSEGINLLEDRDLNSSLAMLSDALLILKHEQDFSALSKSHYYLGRVNLQLGKKEVAKAHFVAVDSLFNVHGFIEPEIHANYQFLLGLSSTDDRANKKAYYFSQYLKADSLVRDSQLYLSSALNGRFQVGGAQMEMPFSNLDRPRRFVVLTLALLTLGLVWFFVMHSHRRLQWRRWNVLYVPSLTPKSLQFVDDRDALNLPFLTEEVYSRSQIQTTLKKIQDFEKCFGYLDAELKLEKLAGELQVPARLLSYVVNHFKQESFTTYVNRLRIEHAKHLLDSDPQVLKLSVLGLAQSVGLCRRQTFTRLFNQYYGVPPGEYAQRIRVQRALLEPTLTPENENLES